MPSWIEAIFAFFFKYRPSIFAKGDLVFGAPASVQVLLAIGVLIAVPAVLTYAGVRGRSTRRDRWILGALRVGVVVILMLCLFRPQLHVSEAIKLRNFVAVLVDDSRSMQITDQNGKPRSDAVKRLLGGKDSSLYKDLAKDWQVRFFKFGPSTDRIDQVTGLAYGAPETHVIAALERVCQEMEAVPMSGIVLLSDGADNSKTPIADQLNALRAKCAPVFAIATGDAKFKRDAELRRAEGPRNVLKGTSHTADLLVSARGLADQKLPVFVEDNGRVIAVDTITMPADGEVVMQRVHAKLDRPGPRLLTFRIPLQKDEQVTQNNTFTMLVNVRDAIEKVLYLEGEPRYEIGFIRRAIGADSNVQLVSVTRTAEGTKNMYLRLGVTDSLEGADGFPRTKAELFKYRAVVIGSIEASAFDHEQLQMLADFVSVRGGGMLFLGGRKSFTEGGYAGTPVGDVMPIRLQGDAVDDSMTFIADLRVGVTPAGAAMSITEIDKGEDRSARRWGQLPIVTSVNYLPWSQLKPGAITLLKGVVDGEGRSEFPNQVVGDKYEQPILVYQNFGRGVAIALPVQDTYHWQMNPAADEKDDMFNTFWRQMMRWMVADVPNRVNIAVPNDQVNPGSSIAIRADIADSLFVPKNDVDVVAQVRGPDGIAKEIPMSWAVDRDGEYRAAFTPTDTGLHKVVVMATPKDGPTMRDSVMVRMGDLNTEFVDAEMREPLLKRIADETNGKLYKSDNTKSLPADLKLSKAGVTKMNQFDLWDMPILFFLMLGLVTAEWAYRKLRGLA